MNCTYCGNKIFETDRYCPQCNGPNVSFVEMEYKEYCDETVGQTIKRWEQEKPRVGDKILSSEYVQSDKYGKILLNNIPSEEEILLMFQDGYMSTLKHEENIVKTNRINEKMSAIYNYIFK
jgi:hypothetical protein